MGFKQGCKQANSMLTAALHGVYMGFTWVYRVYMGFAGGLHGFTGFARASLQGVNIEHRVGLHGLHGLHPFTQLTLCKCSNAPVLFKHMF